MIRIFDDDGIHLFDLDHQQSEALKQVASVMGFSVQESIEFAMTALIYDIEHGKIRPSDFQRSVKNEEQGPKGH